MDLQTSRSAGALEPEPAPPDIQRDASAPQATHAPALVPAQPLVLIDAERSSVWLDLRDLWRFRELLYFLTWRDIKVRYKQTLMGAAWVVIQPIFSMLLFTLVFNKFAGLSSGDIPYPLFAYTGLLLWTFFANAVINGTYSLINNTNLITKVYFPRMFIPAAAIAAGLVDFAIASLILCGLAVYYAVVPSAQLLLLPCFVALTLLLALGVGFLTSALTVKYRDLRHALPFIIQLWMFASPVIYPASKVTGAWRWVLVFNPLTGIIEGFRSALVGRAFDWTAIGIAAALTLVVLVTSLYVFRRAEETFADLV
ncbi:MAG TPA: ABC transporter permease [Pyrinomonadaceae bacterium]|jgi:lipopolysaccharide transport system permease protein|nr:ABC transporter permease [Pyrinomonadaceae bacterium]